MRSLLLTVFVAAILAACSDSSTSPEGATEPGQRPSFSVAVPGTTIAINSISCSLVSPTTSDVLCSYSVSNPDGLVMLVMPRAYVNIAYDCKNPTTGKVVSTGVQTRIAQNEHNNVTATTYSATNEPLPPVALYTTTDPSNRYNPCKGKQIPVVTGYSSDYYDIWVSTNGGYACAASDFRNRCPVL